MNNNNFNIFFSDASFDHKTKVASIGIVDIQKNSYNFVAKANSPYEAEVFGLNKAVEIAIKNKNWNCVFISDNKQAVIDMRKKRIESFWFVQFVWIPRGYNTIADFLSKNIDNEKEFIELKTDSLKDRAKKISNKALSNVMDLKIENKDEIEYRLKQLQALLNVSNIKTDSLFLNKVKKGEFDGLEELLFSGELINLENEKIKDPFINSYIKSIIDIFIFT